MVTRTHILKARIEIIWNLIGLGSQLAVLWKPSCKEGKDPFAAGKIQNDHSINHNSTLVVGCRFGHSEHRPELRWAKSKFPSELLH